jgi:transposase
MYIEKSYRDINGKPRKRNILTLGYADNYLNEYEDPIAHFREVARQMGEAEKNERRVNLSIDMDELLPESAVGVKNVGYAVIMKIYYELEIDKFLHGQSLGERFKFNANSIMLLLVITRLLSPSSKKRSYESRERYFERFDFSLDDIYRSLSHFDTISKELQRYLHESVRCRYGSDTSIIYYDVTNYYFEIKRADDFRKYGVSKEKRKRPIIQMGLAMDKDGIPLHYELFPGNKLDKETFRSVVGNVRKNYDTGRVIVVADMGIITGDNIYYLVGSKPTKPKNGYIFSFSVRGGTEAFQSYVLDATGYTDKDGKPLEEDPDFMIKERMVAREINVTMQNGKTAKKNVYEKQVVFWSKKHFRKAREERAEIIGKAEALIATPANFTKATSYGAAAYVSNIEFDKNSGEVLEQQGQHLSLNYAKIAEEELFDGYYSIVTSEIYMATSDIVDNYKGLWEIEETFKITKSDLIARPVYLGEREHINAHFLVCFIALTIIRLIQKKTDKNFSAATIIECLNNVQCFPEHDNIYLFGYRSPISDLLAELFGFDFSKKRLMLADIKNIFAKAKFR